MGILMSVKAFPGSNVKMFPVQIFRSFLALDFWLYGSFKNDAKYVLKENIFLIVENIGIVLEWFSC